LDNITDAINDGVGDAVNGIVSGFIEGAGVRDQYVLYQQKICEGDAKLDKCSSYEDKEAGTPFCLGASCIRKGHC
jgi:hypothetical protein